MASTTLNRSLETALRDLQSERARIDAAIEQLEGFIGSLANGPLKKLGRKKPGPKAGSKRRRAAWSPAARRAAAQRMKRYWAARRKQAAAS